MWLASDQAACDGNIIINTGLPKIIETSVALAGTEKKFDIGFGAVGEVAISNALRFFLDTPGITVSTSDIIYPDRYVVRELMPAIRKAFTDSGIEDGNPGNDLLIAFMGKLYSVGHMLDVIVPSLQFEAIGSGREVALGSLYTTTTLGFEAVDSIHSAMTAADVLTAYVRGPYIIKKIYPLGVKRDDETHRIL